MKNEGRELTDKALAQLEKKIAGIYRKTEKELGPDIDAYFKQFEKADKEKQAALEAGEITKEEYKQWRARVMVSGKGYEVLRDKIADEYLKANKEARGITNDKMMDVFALNHNYESYLLESRINVN